MGIFFSFHIKTPTNLFRFCPNMTVVNLLSDMALTRVPWFWFGVVLSLFDLLVPADGFGGELGATKITAVRNVVEYNDGQNKKAADVGRAVTQGQSVVTREQSLAELVADDSSVIRLGSHSVFSYSSKERIVKLDKGTMLMHTPPGNGGATIESGGVTGAISGTTFMLTASPAKCSQCGQELQVNDAGKVICRDHPDNPPSSGGFALVVLEGSSVTKVSGPDGITVDVLPGQMAVVGPKGSGAPTVYAVNITQIARTSPLINAFPNPLPSLPQIISTAYNLQNQNIGFTGTSGVAISSRGQLLTAQSPPPDPFLKTFLMAHNQPGQNNSGNFNNSLANIATSAGGGGPVIAPTGLAPVGGGGFAGPTLPSLPATPNNNGQQGVTGNRASISATATVASKVYDGTTVASLTGASLTGPANNVSLANATTGTFASPNVGTGISVTTGMTLTGSGTSLYSFTSPNLSGTITARSISISGSMVQSKEYDGTVTATVNVGTLVGLVAGESLGATTAVGTFADRNVGTKNVAAVYTLVNGANLASNYLLAGETLSGTITAKPLSVTPPAIQSKAYDGQVTAGAVSVGTLSGFVGNETVTASGTAANYSSANVGSYSSVVSYTLANGSNGGLASNYSLAADTATGVITAKNVTVTASSVGKVYDGNTAAVVTLGTLIGLVGTEQLQVSILGGSGTGTYASRNVGASSAVSVTYQLADDLVSGGLASNYNLVNQTETITGQIVAKDLQVFNGQCGGDGGGAGGQLDVRHGREVYQQRSGDLKWRDQRDVCRQARGNRQDGHHDDDLGWGGCGQLLVGHTTHFDGDDFKKEPADRRNECGGEQGVRRDNRDAAFDDREFRDHGLHRGGHLRRRKGLHHRRRAGGCGRSGNLQLQECRHRQLGHLQRGDA
ncbi:MAG: hypothetical protein EB090_05925, partial [Verrucomicrobia bacterium]|nr:hypothetical protein [Verrucomicrobiota bacterium]